MMIPQDRADALINAAGAAMDRAYAPYSDFRVGAAVLSGSGEIYCGCNVENASYGLTTCAERTAIFSAICSGERTILAIAIQCSTGETAYPCGACRQVIAEFASSDVPVYLASDHGTEVYKLAELLPHAFGLRKPIAE
jgi:cytidine deaminase